MLGRFSRVAEGKVFRLEHQGVAKSGFAAGDEKRGAGDVVEAMDDKKAILGFALGFERAAAPNVHRTDTAFQESRADHQESVALQGIFLGTHEGRDASSGKGEGALDALDEIRCATAHGVVDEPIFPVRARISGPAAKSFPKKFVVDANRSKTRLQWFAIELRKTEAGRAAADVA